MHKLILLDNSNSNGVTIFFERTVNEIIQVCGRAKLKSVALTKVFILKIKC